MSNRLAFSIDGSGLRRGQAIVAPNNAYSLQFRANGQLEFVRGSSPVRLGAHVYTNFGIPPSDATELWFSISRGIYVGLQGPSGSIRLATLSELPTALEVTNDGKLRIIREADGAIHELWTYVPGGPLPSSPLDQAIAAAPQGVRDLLGEATGPETPVGNNGLGRQFRGGWFYWSPDTGGHEVHGDILGAYLSTGGPNGELGFPTSHEEMWIAIAPQGRSSTFERGNITWTPDGGSSVNYAPRANYVVSVRRDGDVRIANIATGEASGFKVPATKIDSAKQKEIVDKIVAGVKDYLLNNKDDILAGNLKAEDVIGTTFAITGTVIGVQFGALEPVIIAAATQQGRFYGAAIDDIFAKLKGESPASLSQIVGVLSTVYFIQYEGALSVVSLAGADGWSIIKQIGGEIGGRLEESVRAIAGAVGDVTDSAGDAVGWIRRTLNLDRMRLQLLNPSR